MRVLISLVCIGAVSICHADPLFESHELLNVRLEAPLQEMARDRSDEPEERPGLFSYTGAGICTPLLCGGSCLAAGL